MHAGKVFVINMIKDPFNDSFKLAPISKGETSKVMVKMDIHS